jgi:TonB family protein
LLTAITKVIEEKNFWFSRARNVPEDKAIEPGGGTVFFQDLKRLVAVGLMLISVSGAAVGPSAVGQEASGRKVKSRLTPVYPELARRMKIAGVVKVQVVVAPNGIVKDAKVMGGHPVLATAALDAVRKWRFEVRPEETTENLEFHFDPDE